MITAAGKIANADVEREWDAEDENGVHWARADRLKPECSSSTPLI